MAYTSLLTANNTINIREEEMFDDLIITDETETL
jgi:hypothetical protein